VLDEGDKLTGQGGGRATGPQHPEPSGKRGRERLLEESPFDRADRLMTAEKGRGMLPSADVGTLPALDRSGREIDREVGQPEGPSPHHRSGAPE
jgi:hypothetical protein